MDEFEVCSDGYELLPWGTRKTVIFRSEKQYQNLIDTSGKPLHIVQQGSPNHWHWHWNTPFLVLGLVRTEKRWVRRDVVHLIYLNLAMSSSFSIENIRKELLFPFTHPFLLLLLWGGTDHDWTVASRTALRTIVPEPKNRSANILDHLIHQPLAHLLLSRPVFQKGEFYMHYTLCCTCGR